MTTKIVTDEQYGQLAKRVNELLFRVHKGAVDYKLAMDGVQKLSEPVKGAIPLWIQRILEKERCELFRELLVCFYCGYFAAG